MGICKSTEYILIDYELDDIDNFKPLPMIKKFKFLRYCGKKINKMIDNESMMWSQKNNIFWIYKNENYFKNNI